ncbi:MAG: hypothetical protein K2O40_06440, partial [Lachnospiraceae bacterium]|nr:hypothetical protein [Lachnospiraceae bacterium]
PHKGILWTKVLIFQGANPIFDVGSLSFLTTYAYSNTLLLRVHLETDFAVIFLTELPVFHLHLLPDKSHNSYERQLKSTQIKPLRIVFWNKLI